MFETNASTAKFLAMDASGAVYTGILVGRWTESGGTWTRVTDWTQQPDGMAYSWHDGQITLFAVTAN